MIRATLTVTRKGDASKHVDKIVKASKGPTSVKVGLPKGKAAANVIEYAVYNHEGTVHIPRRPFITVAMFKGRAEIRGVMRTIARGVIEGKSDLRVGMEKLGLKGAGLVQSQISSNMGPPNKASTVRQKGSSTTLIDSGRMRQSITHEVEG
jgi:hypothetical protein